ncbi:MAG: hypothetical protein ABI780_04945 [Ardenticatenales bacterium]
MAAGRPMKGGRRVDALRAGVAPSGAALGSAAPGRVRPTHAAWIAFMLVLAATGALGGCRAAPAADEVASSVRASATAGATDGATDRATGRGDDLSMPAPPSGPVVIDPHSPPSTTDPAGLPGTPDRPLAVPDRLTDGGCCVRPFWRADSQALWFIDRSADGVTGFYEARLDAPLTAPSLVTTTIATLSPDQRWRIDQAAGRTTLVRLADGAAFDVAAGGRSVTFSPDGARIAWQADNPNAGIDGQVARIMVGAPDGSPGQEVARLPNGSLVDWLSDDALLVRARANDDPIATDDVLWRQPLDGGARTELLRGPRMRGLTLSPDRRHLAYSVSGTDAADEGGLWLATLDGASPPRRLNSLFGAYRWRDARRLIIVPFDVGAPSMRLVELDADTLVPRPLTDPAAHPFRIAGGDWSVSPDGRRAAFVSADDRNIWVMALP